MKFTITKALDKIALIKFFRARENEWKWSPEKREVELSLKEANQMLTDLPLVFSDLTESQTITLKQSLANLAEFNIEKEPMDEESTMCGYGAFNYNINPPPETEAALLWFDGLSDAEKIHIRHLMVWLNRPAVC